MDTFLVEGRVRQVGDELCVVLSIDEALGREGVSEHVKEGGKGTDQEGSKEMPEYLAPRSPVPHLVKGQLKDKDGEHREIVCTKLEAPSMTVT